MLKFNYRILAAYGTVSILSGPAEYRQSAAECLRLARRTDDSGTKALYLQMAQAWIKLADDLETRPARDALVFQGAAKGQTSN